MAAYSIPAGWWQSVSCGARTDRLEVTVDLPPPLHQVVIHLQSKEEPFRHSEIAREPEVRVGGDVAFAEHDLIDAAGGDVDGARQAILAQTHRLGEIFKQDFAGMRVAKQAAPRRGSRRFRHSAVLLHPRPSICA